MRVAKGRITAEKEKNKKAKTDAIVSALMGDLFIAHVDQGWACIQYVCTELLKRPKFQSELVVGSACFDYSIVFALPRNQEAGCYSRSFQCFRVRG